MDRVINRMLRRGLRTSHVNRCSVSSLNVRKMFLEYFEGEHGHLLIPSSPVMPDQDATLSFVNSGMNQFKDIFLGLASPGSGRVVNSQKCIRIKGKHNDLDVVGLDGYHHTFFEMLGNWSFGDYFKKEACYMSWNLLTKVYNIPENRLYVTYFKGDEVLNLPPDTETRDIWAEIGVPQNRILPFGMRENFWEMASTGPCGPCTEIHYDHDGRTDAASLVNTGSPRVVEIWNLVFMEFNRTGKGLENLGQCFVDTGMGFERLVAVLQGQVSNYETDIFRPLFGAIQKMSGHSGYNGRYDGDEMDTAYRILADHVRMLTVALGDGMIPNMQNKVRAIFRKAWNLSRKNFKVDKGLIKELSNHVAEFLIPAYPEIGGKMNMVHYIIEEEEEFLRQKEALISEEWFQLVKVHPSLKKIDVDAKQEFLNGYKFLMYNVIKNCDGILSSKNAWKLFDTYGVPVKNIMDMARILGLEFDCSEYEKYEKDLVKENRIANEDKFISEKTLSEKVEIKLSDLGPDPTEDNFKFEYDFDSDRNCILKKIPVKILAILDGGESVESIKANCTYGEKVAIVLDKTNCFYETREMKSDKAVLEVDGGTELHVYTIKKLGNKIFHYVSCKAFPLASEVKVNSTGMLQPKEVTRLGIMQSWTGLHLLKTLLNAKFKVFMETSCQVSHDMFSICFTSYKENLNGKDILELEKSVLDVIESGAVIERELCDVKEIGKMENFIRRTGQTFVEPKIPICKITGRNFKGSLPCPGPVLSNASDVKDFVITSMKKTGYRIKEITAVTGEKAKSAREKNKEFLEKWNHLRDFHVAEFATEAEVQERIRVITEFVKNFMEYKNLSYYIKECLTEETTNKLIKLQKYVKRGIRKDRKIQRLWERS